MPVTRSIILFFTLSLIPTLSSAAESDWTHFQIGLCADYTGTPLMECEAGTSKTLSPSQCKMIFDYAKRCQKKHLCNHRFEKTKLCSRDEDFDHEKE